MSVRVKVLHQKQKKRYGEASFDFSLITAFKVTEKVSERFFETGFGTATSEKEEKTTPKTTQEKILQILRDKPETTKEELAELIGISIDGIKYHIRKMTKEKIIKYEGSSKTGKWIIF